MLDVLVRWGALSVGDAIVTGTAFGRVKSMTNEEGENITTALPSQCVRVLGLRSLPSGGHLGELLAVASEARARDIVDRRMRVAALRRAQEAEAAAREKARATAEAAAAAAAVTTAAATNEATSGQLSENRDGQSAAPVTVVKPALNVILKTESVGSLDALKFLVTAMSSRTEDIDIQVENVF
jgi:translation initiation factor IF-2